MSIDAPSRRLSAAGVKALRIVPMDRSNPYESAFEAFLQEQGLCYVAVDETRRSMLGDRLVKVVSQQPFHYEDKTYTVTISAGVATICSSTK